MKHALHFELSFQSNWLYMLFYGRELAGGLNALCIASCSDVLLFLTFSEDNTVFLEKHFVTDKILKA